MPITTCRWTHLVKRSSVALMAGLFTLAGVTAAQGQSKAPIEPRLMMSDIYFHEDHDQDWELRITGNVPSRPGMYLLLHDDQGRIVVKQHVPYGEHPADKPLVIPVPADGYAGDYRLITLGFQEDIRGLLLPLSNLPHEVYAAKTFAARDMPPLYFKAPPGVETLHIRSYMVGQKVYDGDQPILDTQADGKFENRNWIAPLKVTPGKAYNFRNLSVLYFGSPDGLLLCFDINRWFAPDQKIVDVKWWRQTQ